MGDWMVGFRDGGLIDYEVRSADEAADAAEVVRADRPHSLIVAVIKWPDPANWHNRIEYSDLPPRYRALRRYDGPPGHHGYLVVTQSVDRSRGTVPNRPISLEQARWHRDWMLRGYFECLHAHLRRPVLAAPLVPEIVRLEIIHE
ncbi:hypothetical protein [Curtobacterium sp. VKM Ac-2887]|uniref:hypothetical protein n=1 Tax=Curtobacterium sp. VKM Ac-2887 TaxID=2783819 RepID=UPI00188B53AD|nr:hypothetical protein [Curtobacterium sp. VKM Ac-2887]MBF4588226.1 hypothetical protein [Curtobacterium sp. VKM Ac-2887]